MYFVQLRVNVRSRPLVLASVDFLTFSRKCVAVNENSSISRRHLNVSLAAAAIASALLLLPSALTLESFSVRRDTLNSATMNGSQGTIRVSSSLVQVDALVSEANGNPIENLDLKNFQLSEDNHPQKLVAVDYFDVRKAQILPDSEPVYLGLTDSTDSEIREAVGHDHRLLVLYFDLSSLREGSLLASVTSAKKFVHEQITPADLVTVIAFNSMRLVVPVGFTNDQAMLDMALDSLRSGTVNNRNNLPPDGSMIAREGLSKMLARFPGRKSVIDFTGTVPPPKILVRQATDAANTSDVSFYEIDARGLTTVCADASEGAGEAIGRGARGGCLSPQFNGTRTGQDLLAHETGGALFVDRNDFTPFFKQILDESTGYYLLSYESSNHQHDGKYRSISVKLIGVQDARIKSRPGYTAPLDRK